MDGSANVNASAVWGTPVAIGELDTADNERDPCLTDDELEIFFHVVATPAADGSIWTATRASTSDPFGLPSVAPGLNSGAFEDTPEITGDGLTIYFSRGGSNATVYRSTRTNRTSPWTTPTQVPELTVAIPTRPSTVIGDRTIYLTVGGVNAGDLYRATRPTTTSPWGMPVPLSELNTATTESDPYVSADERTIYFNRGTTGLLDVVRAVRGTATDLFGPAEAVNELNSESDDADVWVSPSGTRLYFSSERDGTRKIYLSTR